MTSMQISPSLPVAKDLLSGNPDGLKELVRAHSNSGAVPWPTGQLADPLQHLDPAGMVVRETFIK